MISVSGCLVASESHSTLNLTATTGAALHAPFVAPTSSGGFCSVIVFDSSNPPVQVEQRHAPKQLLFESKSKVNDSISLNLSQSTLLCQYYVY